MTVPWSLPLILTGRPLLTGVLGALLLFSACTDEGTPPPDGPPLSLRALDASCTEVWLEVRLAAGVSPRTISLRRDSLPILTTTLRSTDTLVVDEWLSPNRRYTYTLTQPGGLDTGPASATIVTMDTTSHDFTWQVDTLGATASSLNDVVIINDTLAYAVGEIYLRDSAGQVDPNAYNLVKWNGASWELKRIPFLGPCSAVLHPPLKAIWAFTATDILVTNGGSIVRYDGANAVMDCRMNPLLSGALNKIYATSPQDVFAVGNSGTIVHFDGSTWRRIESGTTLPMRDIYGSRMSRGGGSEILATAEAYSPGGSKVFSIENTVAREVQTSGLLSEGHWGIWFKPDRQYVVSGAGIWKSHLPAGTWALDDRLPRLFSRAIRGQDLNDIVVSGDFWLLAHWNGGSWRTYFPGTASSLGGISVRGNLVIAVGFVGRQAVAIRGTR